MAWTFLEVPSMVVTWLIVALVSNVTTQEELVTLIFNQDNSRFVKIYDHECSRGV